MMTSFSSKTQNAHKQNIKSITLNRT